MQQKNTVSPRLHLDQESQSIPVPATSNHSITCHPLTEFLLNTQVLGICMQASQLPCTRLLSYLQTSFGYLCKKLCCHLQEPLHAAVKVSGIGKYPFLALERSELRFGDVLVGEQVEQAVQLLNQGLVPADFCVKPLLDTDGVTDDTIKVSPTRSGLWKESLRYLPNAEKLYCCPQSLFQFQVNRPGGMPVGKMTSVYPKELAISHAYMTCWAHGMLFSGC